MDNLTMFLITIAIGATGGLIARKLGIPSGAMVGSMFFVIIFNLITEKAYFIPDVKTGLQILSGAMTGCRVGREDVEGLKKLVKPIILLLSAFILMNFTFGGLMILFTDLDVPTALFATSPGGASDMALIGEELGANPAYIALLQVLRLLIIFTCCPPLFKYLFRTGRMKKGEGTEDPGIPAQPGMPDKTNWTKLVLVFAVCTAAGLFFRWLGITSGAMLGSMLAGATFTVFMGKNRFPSQIRVCMSILSGAFMGCRFSRADLANIDVLAIPILIMLIGLIVFILFNGFLVSKFTDLDYPTALFASTPGGMTEMAILAEDMGVDSFKVSILHTIRLFFVIAFFPTMNKLLCSLFNR
ncbi:MAG: AbrB family transcriptional regulator [Oscillospiraceae bacterium]|jgi:membrane protein AbrB duplication|nr:AbrB family transcriptional regulator [Oscillospiraceae bacterium]MBQ4240097.1 AbrB family transcriptional regulator [Oscillospiraceae bacterium]